MLVRFVGGQGHVALELFLRYQWRLLKKLNKFTKLSG